MERWKRSGGEIRPSFFTSLLFSPLFLSSFLFLPLAVNV